MQQTLDPPPRLEQPPELLTTLTQVLAALQGPLEQEERTAA